MQELTILLLLILGYFIYINIIKKSIYLESVSSTVNHKSFLVRKLEDKQEAADILDQLSQKLVDICNYSKNMQDISEERKDSIQRLISNFKPDKIIETMPGSSHVAYSVNKGTEISICIRDKETNKFIDFNTIMFVAIHELAHIMTDETGHTPKFWDNMSFLLECGKQLNIYNPVDYQKHPINYCGKMITSTPLKNL